MDYYAGKQKGWNCKRLLYGYTKEFATKKGLNYFITFIKRDLERRDVQYGQLNPNLYLEFLLEKIRD